MSRRDELHEEGGVWAPWERPDGRPTERATTAPAGRCACRTPRPGRRYLGVRLCEVCGFPVREEEARP